MHIFFSLTKVSYLLSYCSPLHPPGRQPQWMAPGICPPLWASKPDQSCGPCKGKKQTTTSMLPSGFWSNVLWGQRQKNHFFQWVSNNCHLAMLSSILLLFSLQWICFELLSTLASGIRVRSLQSSFSFTVSQIHRTVKVFAKLHFPFWCVGVPGAQPRHLLCVLKVPIATAAAAEHAGGIPDKGRLTWLNPVLELMSGNISHSDCQQNDFGVCKGGSFWNTA